MLKNVDGHSEQLEDFLSDVVLYGVGVVTHYKLMRWTAAQRMAPRVWKLVQDVFEDVLKAADEHEQGYKLFIGGGADTYSFVIWDRGESEKGHTKDPWWKPIEALAEPKVRKRGEALISDGEPKPLSTHLIEILTAAGDRPVKKDDLIEQTKTPDSSKSHGNAVTRMLEKLERGGIVENPEHGFWKIID
jgi:hypothetical protein